MKTEKKGEDTKKCSICGEPCPIVTIEPHPEAKAERVNVWFCKTCDLLTPKE